MASQMEPEHGEPLSTRGAYEGLGYGRIDYIRVAYNGVDYVRLDYARAS